MAPIRDFESSNARDWDEDSRIAEPSDPSGHTNRPLQGNTGQVAILGHAQPELSNNREYSADIHNGDDGTTRGFGNTEPSADRAPPYQDSAPNIRKAGHRSPNRGHQESKNGAGRDRRNTGPGPQNHHPSSDVKPERWIRGPKLVTTRMNNMTYEKEREKAQSDKYLLPVEGETDYPSTAYYLWPKKDANPRELLGWKLEKLDVLRKTHKVLIEWDDRKHCLAINSERSTSDHALMAAIKGIRQVVRSSEAEVVFASPQYIVNPPTASMMRAKVQPKYDSKKNIIGVELGGRQFSTLEQELWRFNRDEMIEKNLARFRDHLRKHTSQLAHLMGWMRMRVHFGHATLGKVREDFVQLKYSLDEFTKMMDMSRVRTSGKFDRKLYDATLAAEIRRRIVESPHCFCPVRAKIFSLEDVQPKHMGIIFVNIPDGENLRIEADVDYTLEHGLGQYQIGSTRLFRDDRRNKRVEVTTLDMESEFDWTLEIITDGSVSDIPDQLLSLIEGSLSGNSKGRKDCLGLSYPGVAPKFTLSLDVRTVVVRSVYQYLLRDSGNIVEIAVYREWNGYNTTGEPKMLSSVSMFHPVWDDQMNSIENTTSEREWDPELKCFFGKDQSGGIRKLMEDVVLIQGLLSDAARASKELQNVLCSYEGMDKPVGGA